jgi:hypothetical protein
MIARKLQNAVFWLATGYVLFLLGFSVWVYHVRHEMITAFFSALGYPEYLVYPLAYAKLLVIVIIVSHRYNDLRDMAYAAYFINMVMALVGHVVYGDSYLHASLGAMCLAISYLLGNKVRGRPENDFFARFTDP